MSDLQPGWLSRQYVDYVYMPGLLLVVGTAIVRKEWLPYSVAVAAAFGAYNIWSFRKSYAHQHRLVYTNIILALEIKRVLKPDTFQEFELQEKTIISHNVAMYAIPRASAQLFH